MPRPFVFDRTWVFAASPHEFFATVAQTDEFTQWWSWLCVFEVDGPDIERPGADGLHPGEQARCVIQAPLPYALRLTIALEAVEADALVATQVEGDLRGPASRSRRIPTAAPRGSSGLSNCAIRCCATS